MSKRGRILISFQSRKCSRCGGTRLSTQDCPFCGAKAHPAEYQADVQAREKLIRAFHLARLEPQVAHPQLGQLGEDIDAIHSAMKAALAEIPKGLDALPGLLQAFHKIDSLAATWTQLQPRPQRNKYRRIGRSLKSYQAAFEMFLDVMRTQTISDAESLARSAQIRLDQASNELDLFEDYSWYEDQSNANPADFAQDYLARERDRLGAKNLRELNEGFRKNEGLSNSSSFGSAIELGLYRPLITQVLDEERFGRLTSVTQNMFPTAELKNIASSAVWQDENGRVAALFSSSLSRAFVESRGSTELEVLGSLLSLTLHVREGILKHLLITALAASGRDYDQLLTWTSGQVIKASSTAFPGLDLDDLDVRLRHASGHMDFDISAGRVLLGRGSRGVEFSEADFVDKVLEYVEVAIALQVGLARVAAENHIRIEPSRHVSDADIRIGITTLSASVGWRNAAITSLRPNLVMTATGDPERFPSFAAAIAPTVPSATKLLEVTLKHGKLVHACLADIEVIRSSGSADISTAKGAASFAVTQSAISVDGASLLTHANWLSLVRLVRSEGELQLQERIGLLRALRVATVRANMGDVAQLVEDAIKRLRTEGTQVVSRPRSPFGLR